MEAAVEYTAIVALGMPFAVLNAGGGMLIRADGSPKYAMFITMIGAILNIILDPVFIFGFDMGMTGAALTTIIGQIVSGIITLCYFRKFKKRAATQGLFCPRFQENERNMCTETSGRLDAACYHAGTGCYEQCIRNLR